MYGKKFLKLLEKISHKRFIYLSIIFGVISLVNLSINIYLIVYMVREIYPYKYLFISLPIFIVFFALMVTFIVLRVYENRNFKRIVRRSAEIASLKAEDENLVFKQFYLLRKKKDYDSIITLSNHYYLLIEEDLKKYLKKINKNKPSSKKSSLEIKVLPYLGFKILLLLIIVFSLGLAYPVAYYLETKYEINMTNIDRKVCSFHGLLKPLMKAWLKWLGLVVLTCGVYAFFISKKFIIWRYKYTHIDKELSSLGGGYYANAWTHFFLKLGTKLLLLISLGLVKPWCIAWINKYEISKTIIDGRTLYFNGKSLSLGGKIFLWWFLTLFTLGLYSYVINLSFKKWVDKHTHLKNGYKQAPLI